MKYNSDIKQLRDAQAEAIQRGSAELQAQVDEQRSQLQEVTSLLAAASARVNQLEDLSRLEAFPQSSLDSISDDDPLSQCSRWGLLERAVVRSVHRENLSVDELGRHISQLFGANWDLPADQLRVFSQNLVRSLTGITPEQRANWIGETVNWPTSQVCQRPQSMSMIAPED